METTRKSFDNGVGLDYRVLFDAVPGLYLVLDLNLVIVAANDAYCRTTMTESDRIVGRALFEVFPDNPDDPNADGVRNLRASLGRVIEFKRPDAMAVQKYDIRTPEGGFAERYWSPINVPVLDENDEVRWIIHRVEDVTDLVRLQAESATHNQIARDQQHVIDELRIANRELAQALDENAQLQADRLYLADLVESSNDAIIARTPDGMVASWNRAAEAMFGYSAEEIIGRPAAIYAPPERRHEAAETFERLKRGEAAVRYETRRVRKDGSEIIVAVTASPIRDSEGVITGTSAILRDVTEQRRAEEKTQNLQADLIHLSRWNTMGMMASTIAHELNQPLTAVVNYVRAARRTLDAPDPKPARVAEFLDKAVAETKVAGGIIRSLREFIDKRETSRNPENINTVVEEALALSRAAHGDAKANVRMRLDPLLSPVFIDKIQIEQVLINLIRNALEAMGTPGGELVIATGPDEAGFVGVAVSDAGSGIAPEIATQLFQPFVTTKEKGMGIGLTICRSIIEAHGGRIWTEPNTPQGVIFRFQLPVTAELDRDA